MLVAIPASPLSSPLAKGGSRGVGAAVSPTPSTPSGSPSERGRGRRAPPRAEPSSLARTSSGRIRRAASSRPTSGASGRSSGLSADTFTDTFTRGTGPSESRSSTGRSASAGRLGQRLQRVEAARRVAVGLGCVTVASPSRSSDTAAPCSQRWRSERSAALRRLADDEPVGHVAHARRRGRASAVRPALVRDIRIAAATGGGCSSTSSRYAVRCRARSSRPRARRGDVDEAEQGGAQLLAPASHLHRLDVERPQRDAATSSGKPRGSSGPPLQLSSTTATYARPSACPTRARSPSALRGRDRGRGLGGDRLACEVEVLGARERTFQVAGHHYALVCCGGLAAGRLARVRGAARRRARLAAGRRLPARAASAPTRRTGRSRSCSAPAAWRRRTSRPTRCARTRTSAGARSTRSTRSRSACATSRASAGRTCC